MHLILTGATGLVGTAVLHHVLSLPATSRLGQKITRLSIIGRRAEIPLLNHPDRPKQNTFTKIEVFEHGDFKDYHKNGLLTKLKEQGGNDDVGVIWALGVSQTLTSSAEQYDEITRVFAVEAAKAFSTDLDTESVVFVYVSGAGATQSPGMFTPLFGRVKGRTETELLELMQAEPYKKTLKVFNARPAGVDSGAEKEQKLVHELTRQNDGGTGGKTRGTLSMRAMEGTFLPVMRAGLFASFHSPTGELARALVELATGDGKPAQVKGVAAGGRTLSNTALQKFLENVV